LRFEIAGSAFIIGDIAIVGMGRAINFDDERRFAADKINGEGPDWMLTHKLIVGQASAAQSGSLSNLCWRLVAAQTASLSQTLWLNDARRHRPNTLIRPSATFPRRREKGKVMRYRDLGKRCKDRPT
jgi:hypothetical protein